MRATDLVSVVVSSRVRLARNLEKIPFPTRLPKEKCATVQNKIVKAIEKLGNFKTYSMKTLNFIDAMVMHEKHLISKNLVENKDFGVACVNEDESISIMINEEDHIRAQCIHNGLSLEKCFEEINIIDNGLARDLNFAFDSTLGYLTSCISNVGTGMRASVMLFLPALSISGEINKVITSLSQKKLTTRGVFGEGSSAQGYLYQISNATSLGQSEREIIAIVKQSVLDVCQAELAERVKMKVEKPNDAKDLVFRAWGTLTNCFKLGYEEFLKLIGQVKLGVALDIIRFRDNTILDNLLLSCLPYSLSKIFGVNFSGDDADIYRAEYIAKVLKSKRIL